MTRTMRSVAVCSTVALSLAVTAAPALARGTVPLEGSEGPEGLTFIETFGLFVALPIVLFVVIALAVMGPSLGKGARHRSGAGLDAPVWLGGVHDGTDQPVLGDPGTVPQASREHHATELASGTDPRIDTGHRGGASGRW